MSSSSNFTDTIQNIRANVKKRLTGSDRNFYRRAITVNNSGKSAQSNYQVCFQLDTASYYTNYKIEPSCSSLRVYDSDGVTPLSFYVEAPNKSYTSVHVRIPSLPASSYTIYVEYGNPELPNLSDVGPTYATPSYPNSIFKSGLIRGWFMSDEISREWNDTSETDSVITLWGSKGSRETVLAQTTTAQAVTDNGTTVNNIPTVRFNGVHNTTFKYMEVTRVNNTIRGGFSYEVFLVEARNSSKSNNFAVSDDGTPATNQKFHMGYSTNTNFVFSQYGNDLNYAVAGYTSQAFRQWSARLDTSSGHYLRLNGIQVANNSNTTPIATANKMRLGYLNTPSNNYFFNGDIAAVITVGAVLNAAERELIEHYLNIKYRLYTSGLPTITVGNESSISDPSTFFNFEPIVTQYDITQSFKNGLFGLASMSGSSIEVKNYFDKTVAVGNDHEDWNTSTINSDSVLIGRYCRELTVTTSDQIDTVTITRSDGVTNISNVGQYALDTEATSDTLTIDDADWKTFWFQCEDHTTIDTTNSWVRYSDGTNYYQCLLSANVNALASDTRIQVKLPVGSFTTSGTPNWSTVDRILVNIRTTASTQVVYYGEFRDEVNFERLFGVGDELQVQNIISDDDFSTNFVSKVMTCYITDVKASDGVTYDLRVESALDRLSRKTFKDLPGFPEDFFIFNAATSDGFTECLQRLLTLAFPDSQLDIDTGEFETAGRLDNFLIYPSQNVKDVLDDILTVILGQILVEPDGTIRVRSIDTSLLNTTITHTIRSNQIYESSLRYDEKPFFNSVTIFPYYVAENKEYFRYFGFAGGSDELVESSTQTYEYAASEFNRASSVGITQVRPYNTIAYIDYGFVSNAYSPSLSNTNIDYVSSSRNADNILIKFTNNNSSVRYLFALYMAGACMLYVNDFSTATDQYVYADTLNGIDTYGNVPQGVTAGEPFGIRHQDTDSVNTYGRSDLFINNIAADVAAFGNPAYQYANFYDDMVKVLSNNNHYLFNIAYFDNVSLGDRVKIESANGNLVNGSIIDVQYQFGNGTFDIRAEVRENHF